MSMAVFVDCLHEATYLRPSVCTVRAYSTGEAYSVDQILETVPRHEPPELRRRE